MAVRKIVLLPCAETELQAKGICTGWAQDGLSSRGKEQAEQAGKLLTDAGFSFDALFTSVQKQAVCTGWLALMQGDRVALPHIQNFRLNDRHWGVYQGKAKPSAEEDPKEAAPPAVGISDAAHPSNDPLYRGVPASARPGSESMKMVVDRTRPFWHDAIAPFLLSGKTPLVVAHEGSVRAICQGLEDDTDAEALEYEIQPGVPLVVELDEELEYRKRTALLASGVAKARRFSLAPAAGPALRQGPTPKPKAKAKVAEPAKPKEDYTVEVTVQGAKGLRDADWFTGTSDPYVKCTVSGKGSGEFRTPTLSNIRAEVIKWNHLEKIQLKHGDSLDFTVYDEDTGKSDDFLGTCTLRFDDILQDFSGTLKLVDEKGKAMPGKTKKGAFLTVAVKEMD
ncbi:gpmA [Symbiodinium sp. CCMP2592]|nr:gpmA [Symbiodinium sp. CCMP2592]